MAKASQPHCVTYYKLYKTRRGVVVEGYNEGRSGGGRVGAYVLPPEHTITSLLEADDTVILLDYLWIYVAHTQPDFTVADELIANHLLAPVDRQVAWAAGVTYETSKFARMEESEAAANCYAYVYDPAHRPELFFKALPHQIVGHGGRVRMSSKSEWFVPEPEFVLAINTRGKIVGYSLGNDMSARDIEGENPLYLPQAKVYDDGFGLGPCITILREGSLSKDTKLSLTVLRNGLQIFHGETTFAKFNRTFDSLADRLFEDRSFPDGVFLSTGTCVVPSNDTVTGMPAGTIKNWTLEPADELVIAADRLGTLSNMVYRMGA